MKSEYTVEEDGFRALWFEGTAHRDKAIIWMHGSSMGEKACIADSAYLREVGYSVLVLGFYWWKGMSRKLRAVPVDYVERAAAELKANGFEKIGVLASRRAPSTPCLRRRSSPILAWCLPSAPSTTSWRSPSSLGRTLGAR